MSNSTNCLPIWPSTTPCSGNGVCINGTCVCQDGWMDVADFQLEGGMDCDFNVLAFRLLSIPLLLNNLLLFGRGMSHLLVVFSMWRGNLKVQAGVAPKIGCWTMGGFCFSMSSILKLVNPQTRLYGLDVAYTLFYSFGMSAVWLVGPYQLVHYLRYLIVSTKSLGKTALMRRYVRRSRILVWVCITIAQMATMGPVLILVNHQWYRFFRVWHYVAILIAILASVTFMLPLLKQIVKELDSNLEVSRGQIGKSGAQDGTSNTVTIKVRRLRNCTAIYRRELLNNTVINVSTAILIAFTPLGRKAAYQTLAAWIIGTFVAHVGLSIAAVPIYHRHKFSQNATKFSRRMLSGTHASLSTVRSSFVTVRPDPLPVSKTHGNLANS